MYTELVNSVCAYIFDILCMLDIHVLCMNVRQIVHVGHIVHVRHIVHVVHECY